MSQPRLVILNRAPAAIDNGWIHIVPRGELPNTEAGLVQVLDETALDAILGHIHREAARRGKNWPGIYAGREHFIYNAGKDSEALAWFKDFEKRADGLWAKADGLTDIGREAVNNRRYKFTSFVADPAQLQKIDVDTRVASPPQLPRYRVMGIETIGFTNQANGRELLTPIVNRGWDSGPETPDHDSRPPAPGAGALIHVFADHPAESRPDASAAKPMTGATPQTNTRKNMNKIATALGLAAEAGEDAILAGVIKIQNRLAGLEPLAAENQSLKDRQAAVDAAAAAALLEARGIRDERVMNRLRPVLAGLPTHEDRAAFLDDCGFKPVTEAAVKIKVLNRGSSAATAAAAAPADEKALTLKIKNRAAELKGAGNRSFNDCWNQAMREVMARPA